MRSTSFAVALVGSVVLSYATHSFAADTACALITQKQVSDALGIAVGEGSPIGRPTACQWFGKGRFATLTLTQPMAGKNPVERFNAGKKGMAGVTTEPVGGVGDDAYYVYFAGTTRAGLGLVVKKGTSSFEVRVYGFELDKAKPVAKTLAQEVAGKI